MENIPPFIYIILVAVIFIFGINIFLRQTPFDDGYSQASKRASENHSKKHGQPRKPTHTQTHRSNTSRATSASRDDGFVPTNNFFSGDSGSSDGGGGE